MRKYFAYGSNMSGSVMAALCPRSRFIARAQLPGHRVAFTRRSVRSGTGVADLLVDDGRAAWGVLYELAAEDLRKLDRKEGAGWAYERRAVQVFTDDGAPQDALAYFVITKSPVTIAPSPGYLQGLLDAGRERALPPEHLEAMARAASESLGPQARSRGPR